MSAVLASLPCALKDLWRSVTEMDPSPSTSYLSKALCVCGGGGGGLSHDKRMIGDAAFYQDRAATQQYRVECISSEQDASGY